jgi:hypothetical protein
MTMLIAVLLAGAVAADVPATNLAGVFEATCLDGSARLSADEVSASSFHQLPSDLKERLGRPSSGNVWRLNGAGNAYLYILDYPAGPGISPKVCGVASDSLDLQSAAGALEVRVGAGTSRQRARTMQWINLQDGYIATATTAAKYNVLQINWMSDADKAAALAQAEQLPR